MVRKELDKIRTICINIHHSLNIIKSITLANVLNYRDKQILVDIEERLEKDVDKLQDVMVANWWKRREIKVILEDEDEATILANYDSSHRF